MNQSMMNQSKIASLLVAAGLLCPGQTAEMRDAAAALNRGDFQVAEQKLRAEVAAHPDDAWALSLLGATLDNLKRVPEADELHRRAVAKAPRAPEILNNYAAHLWIAGDEREAAKVYLQVLAIEPEHYNANLQLARLALKEKKGPDALRYLDRLPERQREQPQVLLPRLEALYLSGDRARADALSRRLTEISRTDLTLSFAVGITLANVGWYDKAETFFETALKGDPANFNTQYNLGAAAARAGHYERAREALDAALHQQPQNVDVLFGLAFADEASHRLEEAVHLLAQAAKLDPRRADVQKMLALTTGELGALDDAMAAWDRYLKLEPDDQIGRRERGYTAAQMGQFEKGIAELEWFASKHPDDAVGHYELGQAESTLDMAKALINFDKALALDPNYLPARIARGSLYYQMGKPETAVKDLEVAASLRPDDAMNLDRLGQTYQALDRNADALRVLRRAVELAPRDSKTLLHLARTLADSGNTSESKTVMDRFRQLGPEKKAGVRAGFVDYLSLTDEQRHADYRARLEKAAGIHPEDAALQMEYLKLLLQEGDANQVAAAAHVIAGLKPGAAVLAGAGRALLDARQYGLASELLKLAEAAAPAGNTIAEIERDLAMATFRMGDPAKGLERLDRVPESGRNGDYHLARAEMLDASAKAAEAREALAKALEISPDQPDVYQRAAAFLLAKGSAPDAARLLEESARIWPQNREILLMKAATEELAGKTDDAEQSLKRIQNRWPEWSTAWVALGVILDVHRYFEDGEKALETAVALGARGPEVYFYLADCSLRSGSSGKAGKDAAEVAIGQALKLSTEDPWIEALAGRIAFERGDYALAVDRLREAIRLGPRSVQAHNDLARAYGASGRQQEAQAELNEAGRLEKISSGSNEGPPYLLGLIRDRLFRRTTP